MGNQTTSQGRDSDNSSPGANVEFDLTKRESQTLDESRPDAAAARRKKGFRTARQNLSDLCDPDSFVEYGQLAVAAQRQRRTIEDLKASTPADGVITGMASINAGEFGNDGGKVAVVVNDFTVLAGTQGHFHHKKLDRILQIARKQKLPIVMLTEGGGGRPGDVDVQTETTGLTVQSFASWAALSGVVPRIVLNNGYCFAGSALLFGCADITIATRSSWIGMAGPAMIEGGGLGTFNPTDIGPTDIQSENGVVDVVVDDEAAGTKATRKILGYFQGTKPKWQAHGQDALASCLPTNRRFSYRIRDVISLIADVDSFVELRRQYGGGIVTGFVRVEGRPIGILANDCKILAGAIDAPAAEKAARFIQLCNAFSIPLLSLCDTPGFMVGPDSEKNAAVRRMSRLFVAGANAEVPWVCVVLRKAYGLGAMAMAGGSLSHPDITVAWPQGEFGAMGLEGAVHLGYKKELEAQNDPDERQKLFDSLVEKLYAKGQAAEVASFVEIDAVIDPTETRNVIQKALHAAGNEKPAKHRHFVDVW